MKLDKYTDRSQAFLQEAEKLASRHNHQYMVPAHLLKVMLEDPEGMAANLLSQAGTPPQNVTPGRISKGSLLSTTGVYAGVPFLIRPSPTAPFLLGQAPASMSTL